MTLSKALKARMCGGCQTRVVTRAEFLDWVRQAEELEQKYEELHEEYSRLAARKSEAERMGETWLRQREGEV